MNVQRIKDEALLGIERSQFENFAGLNRSDHRLIVEKDRAWRARADPRRLKAGLRENQHLGVDVDAEMLEDARKPSVLPVEFELGFSRSKIAIELGDRIVQRAVGVLNGRVIGGKDRGVFRNLIVIGGGKQYGNRNDGRQGKYDSLRHRRSPNLLSTRETVRKSL